MRKKWLVPLICFSCIGVGAVVYDSYQEADSMYQEEQQVELVGEELAVKEHYQKMIELGNAQDLDNYVLCIIPKARKNTKDVLSKNFKEFQIETTLQNFKILRNDGDHILAEAKQKEINRGSKEYKKHIATTNVAFVKEEGQWLVEMTTVVDNIFI